MIWQLNSFHSFGSLDRLLLRQPRGWYFHGAKTVTDLQLCKLLALLEPQSHLTTSICIPGQLKLVPVFKTIFICKNLILKLESTCTIKQTAKKRLFRDDIIRVHLYRLTNISCTIFGKRLLLLIILNFYKTLLYLI